ncbi:MAG TPA: dienelactone hydrolase family protein, partial [Anaerolineales bacterium]|nr:dienelactone hydrolase family protein [Anaerolineales bacterium]
VNAFDAALTEAGVPHEIEIYAGQPHAFVQDAQGIRAGGAQGDAWEQMLNFLEANLKNKSSQQRDSILADYTVPFAWKYYAMLVYEHTFGSAGHVH